MEFVFFKSLTYSPDKLSRRIFTQKRTTWLGQTQSIVCSYLLALLTFKERFYKGMEHRRAVTFNFSWHTFKYILVFVTFILIGCKYQGNWPSEQQLEALVLSISISLFIQVLWWRGILLILAYGASILVWIFSSFPHSYTRVQVKIHGRYRGYTSLELKMMIPSPLMKITCLEIHTEISTGRILRHR